MKKRTYLSAGLALLIGTLSVHASPGLSDVKSRVLPAVYKSKNGLTQKVEISVKHEGEPSTVTIHLGEQSHKEKLVSGDNVFRIEIVIGVPFGLYTGHGALLLPVARSGGLLVDTHHKVDYLKCLKVLYKAKR